jgi:branched-chain amino acid transport system substrate-binding protein
MSKLDHRAGCGAVLVAAVVILASPPAAAQRTYDPGASDFEIKVGQTMFYSGPASAYGTIGKAHAAFFRMINDQGGINGRKINLISYDDGANPSKTVEQVRKLVENDEVLLTFQILGSATNAAVQKYLNAKHVPQLFVGTGGTRFTDPQNYPWTIGFNPSYRTEGRIYGRYILDKYPNAKIGTLYQNDDLGRDYLAGLKDVLGAKAMTMIVADAAYETTDPSIDTQIVSIVAGGADLLYDITTAKFAAQAIKKIAQMNWKPVHILSINSSSVGGVLVPAGLENSRGIISVNYGKDPGDPTWNDDEGMKRWRAFMDKYYPEGDKNSSFNTYAYATAQLLALVLKNCGDDLTRANVMRQATNLKNVAVDILLPGMSITTSPTDYRVIKQLQMMRFNGERWDGFGPIITDEPKS